MVSLVNRSGAPAGAHQLLGLASGPGVRFARPRLCFFGPSRAFGLADPAPHQEADEDVLTQTCCSFATRTRGESLAPEGPRKIAGVSAASPGTTTVKWIAPRQGRRIRVRGSSCAATRASPAPSDHRAANSVRPIQRSSPPHGPSCASRR